MDITFPFKQCLEISVTENPHLLSDCLKQYLDTYTQWEPIIQAHYLNQFGDSLSIQQHLSEALQYFSKATAIVESELDLIKSNSSSKDNAENSTLFLLKADIMINISNTYYDLRQLNQVRQFALEALEIYEQYQDYSGLGDVYNTLSSIEIENLNFPKAEEYQIKSLDYRTRANSLEYKSKRPIGRDIKFGNVLNNLGEIQRLQGFLNQAISSYKKATVYHKEDNDLIGLAVVNNNLGIINTELEYFDKAYQYFQQSQALFRFLKIKDIECLMDFAHALIISRRLDEALPLLQEIKGLIFASKSNNKFLCNLITLFGLWELASVNLGRAIENFQNALSIAEQNGFDSYRLLNLTHLIQWSLFMHRLEPTLKENSYLDKAFAYLDQALLIATKAFYLPLMIELRLIESALFLQKMEVKKARNILVQSRKMATQLQHTILQEKIDDKLKELAVIGDAVSPSNINIVEYVNRIAKIAMSVRED